MDSVGNGSTDGESDLGDVVSLPLCWCLFEVEDEDGGIFFFFFFFGERFSDFSLKVFSFFFLNGFFACFLVAGVGVHVRGGSWLVVVLVQECFKFFRLPRTDVIDTVWCRRRLHDTVLFSTCEKQLPAT